MRKALIIGVDYYQYISGLHGCVNDAHSVKSVLERNSDGTVNFGVKILTGTGSDDAITRTQLKEAVRELFADQIETALLYFAGHGYIETTGGYLCASDCKAGDDGLALAEVMTLANRSPARNRIVVLDSCHSGCAGNDLSNQKHADLSEGITILTASTAEQYASEKNGAGVFTNLFVDALSGAAGNLVGDVTPGSVYAHIDQSLGPWQQRPVFKTNVKSFVSLRKVQAPISLADLHRFTELFPTPGFEFPLDPTYEPESDCPNPSNTEKFAVLQKYNRVNLLVPVGAPHMYHAAMESKSCKLTVLGEHYRRLVEGECI
ncbi:caspase family protein [Azospirillum cavernae]|uniref:Caspase family protein n=1 Tax=Azospirillum cavernae TaxID=2320860 RepID=A0A418W3H4_9PROT|nr:caspase family protein [Azospirillum cavernae]RJF84582.1 caspase family protein [Azospirillum cavernae]